MNFIKKVFSSYIFLLIISFILGFLLNSFFSGFYDYNLLFLQIIFFLSSLKIDPKEFLIESKKIREISWVNVLVLIILPILFYFLSELEVILKKANVNFILVFDLFISSPLLVSSSIINLLSPNFSLSTFTFISFKNR